ncbi:hypothetical protein BDW22DRAFT_1419530 [Trametopsis cervina]|nr:hypothetical protein BDW22DRAFT_1419530 [Trametopsis cervina]
MSITPRVYTGLPDGLLSSPDRLAAICHFVYAACNAVVRVISFPGDRTKECANRWYRCAHSVGYLLLPRRVQPSGSITFDLTVFHLSIDELWEVQAQRETRTGFIMQLTKTQSVELFKRYTVTVCDHKDLARDSMQIDYSTLRKAVIDSMTRSKVERKALHRTSAPNFLTRRQMFLSTDRYWRIEKDTEKALPVDEVKEDEKRADKHSKGDKVVRWREEGRLMKADEERQLTRGPTEEVRAFKDRLKYLKGLLTSSKRPGPRQRSRSFSSRQNTTIACTL